MFGKCARSRPVDIVDRKERLVKAMTEATVNGVRGETYFDGTHDTGAALVNSRTKVQKAINRKLDAGGSGIAKSALDAVDSGICRSIPRRAWPKSGRWATRSALAWSPSTWKPRPSCSRHARPRSGTLFRGSRDKALRVGLR